MKQPEATRRVSEILSGYWDKKRGQHAFPKETDIDPNELQPVWDYCFLISLTHDVENDRTAHHYEYLGPALFSSLDFDAPNPEACEQILAVDRPSVQRAVMAAIQSNQPAEWQEEVCSTETLEYRVRGCVLPLGGAGGAVSYLLGGLNWRAY